MPPTKSSPTARKLGPKTAGPKRQVSDTHKAAMAAGRETGRAVNAYLHALEESRPRRGRKVSKEDLEKRLAVARKETDIAIGTARLLALQLVEDLDARIKALTSAGTDTLESVEKSSSKQPRPTRTRRASATGRGGASACQPRS